MPLVDLRLKIVPTGQEFLGTRLEGVKQCFEPRPERRWFNAAAWGKLLLDEGRERLATSRRPWRLAPGFIGYWFRSASLDHSRTSGHATHRRSESSNDDAGS